MNWLARLCALLLLLAPAAVAAQGPQKAYVGEGGGSNVPPPPAKPKPLTSEDAVDAAKGTYSMGGVLVEGADKFAPDRMTRAANAPVKKLVGTGSTLISTAESAGKVLDSYQDGGIEAAGRTLAKEGGAMLVDRCVDAAINAACATTGPGAPACIVGSQLVKTCVEIATGKSIGQRVVERVEEYYDEPDSATTNGDTVGSTSWSESRREYVDYISKNAPASQAGCHPGHNEQAHPGGCFDYTRK